MQNSTIKKIALGMAAASIINLACGCGDKNSQSQSEQTSITDVENIKFKTNDLYVTICTNPITLEEELFISYIDKTEVFSGARLPDEYKAKLIEYLSLDELKESYTLEELRAICKKLRNSHHDIEKEFTIPNWDSIEPNENEKTFDLKDLYLGIYQNKSTGVDEPYFVKMNFLYYTEIFSNTTIESNCEVNRFGCELIDFIPTNLLKPTYTESELKVLLEYIRDLYHNGKTIYGGRTLQLEQDKNNS